MPLLVDYEISSDSEVDEPENISGVNISLNDNQSGNSQQNLFSSLPPPVKNVDFIEEVQDEFLNKKAEVIENPPKRIKISVPELSSFKEDVDVKLPTFRETQRKCGLFSVLPVPKVAPLKNTCFVPKAVQKGAPSSAQPVQIPQVATICEAPQVSEVKKVETPKRRVSDFNSDEDDMNSPFTYDDETWNELFLKKKKSIAYPKVKKSLSNETHHGSINAAPEAEKPYKGLDNQAFKELFGSRKEAQKINVIELDEDKIHPGREEWLKSLTDPAFEASPLVKAPVNTTSLVKNHITSLAERALTNDKELQIRWALSRNSRNQTRLKYGF